MAVLLCPVVFEYREKVPWAVLSCPVVLKNRACVPLHVFPLPVLAPSAPMPRPVLKLPRLCKKRVPLLRILPARSRAPSGRTVIRFIPPVAMFSVLAPDENKPVPASPEKLSEGDDAVP